MTNQTRQKYIKSFCISDRWGNYEAQPRAMREFLQDFPLNVWPCSRAPITGSIDQLRKDYHMGLESVWGPDHPAVIDAKQRFARRKGKTVELFSADDLELDF